MDSAPAPDTGSTPLTQVSVLLLDSHQVGTDTLRVTLDLWSDLRCVAMAHSVQDGLARAVAGDFAVAIVDLDLLDSDGLDLIASLHALRPRAQIIVLTAHWRPDLADRALAAGAVAFLGKEATLGQFLIAVRTSDIEHPMVGAGRQGASGDGVELTPREHEVLRRLGRGQDANRIAEELGISLHTTRGHIKSVLAKLDVHSQLGAVVSAARLGLITLGPQYDVPSHRWPAWPPHPTDKNACPD